jgi:hypothetical protein
MRTTQVVTIASRRSGSAPRIFTHTPLRLQSAETDHFDDRDRTGGPDPLQTFAPEFCIS